MRSEDQRGTAVPASLARAFNYAGVLYDGNHASLAKRLQDNYGIYPAFAGTGYSVKDSYSLDKEPMTAQLSLADAGCRCISVAPYTGRSADLLDPNFLEQAGGAGGCKSVLKLQPTLKK